MEKFLEIKKDKLGIGTWKMGEIPKNRNEEIASIRYALENGIRLIDTAEMYGNGNSEKLIAESIKDFDREKLYLVSKVLPNNAGEKNIFKSCENSLKNLNVDYLDLYLLHWRGSIPFEETINYAQGIYLSYFSVYGVSPHINELNDNELGKNAKEYVEYIRKTREERDK